MSKIALITGITGQDGSYLAELLLDKGYEVHGILRQKKSKDKKKFWKIEKILKDLILHESNLNDAKSFCSILENITPNEIYHLAAQSYDGHSFDNEFYTFKNNIDTTHNILSSIKKFNKKIKFFFAGSSEMYGNIISFPQSEKTTFNPVSAYGISKLSVEGYLRFYQEQYGLSTTILRYGNVFGTRQNPHGEAGVVAIFYNRLLNGQSPVINGDGEQTRDYVFVGDVVRANLMALELNSPGTYNVGTGRETSVNELTRLLLKTVESDIPTETKQGLDYEQRRSCLDYKKIKESMGWNPKVSLKDGLIETYEFFKKNKP